MSALSSFLGFTQELVKIIERKKLDGHVNRLNLAERSLGDFANGLVAEAIKASPQSTVTALRKLHASMALESPSSVEHHNAVGRYLTRNGGEAKSVLPFFLSFMGGTALQTLLSKLKERAPNKVRDDFLDHIQTRYAQQKIKDPINIVFADAGLKAFDIIRALEHSIKTNTDELSEISKLFTDSNAEDSDQEAIVLARILNLLATNGETEAIYEILRNLKEKLDAEIENSETIKLAQQYHDPEIKRELLRNHKTLHEFLLGLNDELANAIITVFGNSEVEAVESTKDHHRVVASRTRNLDLKALLAKLLFPD